MAYMMVKDDEREKRLASCIDKNNKEDTRLVQPYLARALCLRLGDSSAVPVHDRFLGTRGGSIAVDVSDGTGRGEQPPG